MRSWQALTAVLALVLLVQAAHARADALFDDFAAFKAQAQDLVAESQNFAKAATTHPFAPPRPVSADSAFARKVRAFSTASAALSVQIDKRGGPRDLRCIYRGMAADAPKRLAAAQAARNAGAQAQIFTTMAALFSDAIEVTPQSPAQLADRHDGGAAQCPADPESAIETLPE